MSLFSKFVDESILKGTSVSKLANSTYLFAISELSKSYLEIDTSSSLNQLDNFFDLVNVVSKIIEGILSEHNIVQEYSEYYFRVIEEDSKSENFYPSSYVDHMNKLVELLKSRDLALEECKKEIYPTSLLLKKKEAPFVDADGGEYSTIMDYVSYISKLKTDIKVNSNPTK